MKVFNSTVHIFRALFRRASLLGLLSLSAFFLSTGTAVPAQEKSRPANAKAAASSNAASAAQEGADDSSAPKKKFSTSNPRHEDSDQVKRRERWFYEQRAFPLGRIPAGARLKAFQHMQRMMEAEGKIVRLRDGSVQAVAPQAGSAIGGVWTSLGPTPTTGGFFSPVSGRIITIAVDPSDTTGNTVLIGGAQGGIWRSTDGGATWTPTGDMNPSLAMGSIAFAPSNTSIVYAGTGEQASIGFDTYYGAGVLISNDHGKTWKQTCTTPSPTCPFIGPFTNTLNFGFFNDGGARISYIAVNPNNPNLVLAAAQIPRVGGTVSETAGGIYCSDNSGTTWSPLLIGEAGSFAGFANATTAYAALGRPGGSASGATNPNGVYKSTNANGNCTTITFAPTATQPTTSAMGRIDLGVFEANIVYASVADGSNGSGTNLGVFVTTNGGATWTQTGAPDICQFHCWYDDVVKVDPNNSSIVFFGGGAAASSPPLTFEWVVRSTNAGASFSPAIPTSPNGNDPTLPHVDQHAMAFFKATTGTFANKVRMYLGNDGGLWRTDDAEAATVTWTNLNQNLTLTQFYPSVSVNPSNPAIAYGGAQDNGSQFTQSSLNWKNNNQCGDGGQTAVDFQVPTSVYVTCQFESLFFSSSGGTDPASFIAIGSGIDPNGTDNVDFIPPIATDPSTPGRVYFGTDHVYQSSDNGNTFVAISGVLPTRAGNYLTALGVSPKNPAVVYAGANGGDIFVATNVGAGTASFSQVAGQSQHPFRNVTAIVVDPADPTGNTAYAVFSGFAVGSDTQGHIFKTMNAGASWLDVSCTVANCATPAASDLPNIPVNDLVVDPDDPAHNTLYAATDVGCFVTLDGGLHWNTLGTGLPNVAVLSLKLQDPSRTLVAGTHGRGAWSLSPLPLTVTLVGPHIGSISPTSAQAPVASPLTLTVNGSGLTGATAVQWNAGSTTTALTPTVASDNQVTATVPTSLLASGGTVQVSVSVGATNSNSLTFGVLSAPPTISSASPASAQVNSSDMMITVAGTNFAASSQVILNPDFIPGNGQMNGQILIPTTFKSTMQLTATVPASFMASFGSTNSVGVHTPPPGGGTTSSPPPTGTGTTPLPVFAVVGPVPGNDNIANATSITTNSFTDTKDSSAATTEATDPVPPCVPQFTMAQGNTGGHPTGDYNTIWYKFAPTSSGMANLDATGSNYDTVISIWTGSAGNFISVACNNGFVNPGIVVVSQLHNVPLTGGTTYFIVVSAFGPPDPNPVAFGAKNVLNFSFIPTPDFTITTAGTTSQTVTAGATATYANVLSITAQNGFSGAVILNCSLPAAQTTCLVTPSLLTPGGGSATVTVGTMARGIVLPPNPWRPGLSWRLLPVGFIALAALFLVALRARSRRVRFAAALLPFVALILFLVLPAVGCGGGSGGGGGGTPAGTYTITIVGQSGSLPPHSASLQLVVQ